MRYLFIILCCFIFYKEAVAQETMVFSMPDDDLGRSSFEVLRAAYAKLGIDVTSLILPAKRSLSHSSNGITDGEVQRVSGISNKYKSLLQVPVSLNKIEGIAYTCQNNSEIKGWDSLHNMRIGIRIGAHYAEEKTKGMPNVFARPAFNKLFAMLYSGGIDVVVASKQEMYRQRKNLKASCLRMHTPALTSLPLFHFLHEKHKHLIPKIADALEAMYKNGEAQKIISAKLIDLSK